MSRYAGSNVNPESWLNCSNDASLIPLCCPDKFSSKRTIGRPDRSDFERPGTGAQLAGKFALTQFSRSVSVEVSPPLLLTAADGEGSAAGEGLFAEVPVPRPTGGCSINRQYARRSEWEPRKVQRTARSCCAACACSRDVTDALRVSPGGTDGRFATDSERFSPFM